VLKWRQVVEVAPNAVDALPGEARVLEAAQRSLRGERRGVRALWPFLGPAFIAAVAYVDPGNFATNFAGGAKFGYLLVWVIVASNLMAMLIQTLSAKLGIATGMNLPEVCRERFPRTVSFLLWLQAEVIAMATDLAEFIGAALGLHLLFGIPLFPAGVITAVIAFGILALQSRGFRRLEVVIAGLVGIILAGFAFNIFLAAPDGGEAASGLIPGFDGNESVLLAAGILGATVMPHVIYLHSALTQRRVVGDDAREKQKILRFERIDVVIAMPIAGAINLSMLLIGAAVFNASGQTGISELDEVYHGLGQELGSHADIVFGIALLASGISSSSVGTMAGQIVMQGFIRRRIPLFLRRAITMAPALIVIAIGVDPSKALIVSQVVLSFGIPFALVPLVLFSRSRELMGDLVNRRITTAAAFAVAAVIIALNVVLLYLTFTG
jgi:manganese transport protein